jgi:hypothetical protein
LAADQQTAAGYGDDGWRICEACEDEVLEEESCTDVDGCHFCPTCWAELTAGQETMQ